MQTATALMTLYEKDLSGFDTFMFVRDRMPGLLPRPRADTVIDHIVDDFSPFPSKYEDPAIICGTGAIGGNKVMLMAHLNYQGPEHNFGSVGYDGHMLAQEALQYSVEHHLPTICLVDTPGADAKEEANQMGQSRIISELITDFTFARVPLRPVLLSEGGSGGSLPFLIGDKPYRLACQHAILNVINPTAVAAILKERDVMGAANVMKMTAPDLLEDRIIDAVIPGPDPALMARPEQFPGESDEEYGQRLATATETYHSAFSQIIREALLPSLQEAAMNMADPKGREAYLDALVEQRLKHYATPHPSVVDLADPGQDLPDWLQGIELPNDRPEMWKVMTMETLVQEIEQATYRASHPLLEGMPLNGTVLSDRNLYQIEPSMIAAQLLKKYSIPPDASFFQHKCGKLLDYESYLARQLYCYHCNSHDIPAPDHWLEWILDDLNTFTEHDAALVSSDPLGFQFGVRDYRKKIIASCQRAGPGEGLVTGTGSIYGREVALAVNNFRWLGGSMGAVMGAKYARICQYAIENGLPLIQVSSTGGARMQEANIALMQMVLMNIWAKRVLDAGLPIVTVLTTKSYGGSVASYLAFGYIIALENLELAFSGPGVLKLTLNHDYEKSALSPWFNRMGYGISAIIPFGHSFPGNLRYAIHHGIAEQYTNQPNRP